MYVLCRGSQHFLHHCLEVVQPLPLIECLRHCFLEGLKEMSETTSAHGRANADSHPAVGYSSKRTAAVLQR